VRNAKISQNGEKCKDSSKWSCCNGRPAQVENTKILKWQKIQRFFKSGLVVMGDLPRWKMQRFIKVVKNMKIFLSSEKYKDFSKWWEMRRFLKMVKNAKILQSCLVVMGDRPKWKRWNVWKGRHDRTLWGTRAEKCTRKEVGLEKHTT